jgi:hypothetical protein
MLIPGLASFARRHLSCSGWTPYVSIRCGSSSPYGPVPMSAMNSARSSSDPNGRQHDGSRHQPMKNARYSLRPASASSHHFLKKFAPFAVVSSATSVSGSSGTPSRIDVIFDS